MRLIVLFAYNFRRVATQVRQSGLAKFFFLFGNAPADLGLDPIRRATKHDIFRQLDSPQAMAEYRWAHANDRRVR